VGEAVSRILAAKRDARRAVEAELTARGFPERLAGEPKRP
jgi:hypothetical protein